MARKRSKKYSMPIEREDISQLERIIISDSPAFRDSENYRAIFTSLFPPPNDRYPGLILHEKNDPSANDEREWLIRILSFLVECYPHPINMALESIKVGLVEVNRGLSPNLFRPNNPAKGGKANYIAQEAMNLAILAADYIHDNIGNDDAYRKVLEEAATNSREIDGWRKRLDPSYRNKAIVAWGNLAGAKQVLTRSVAKAKDAIGRAPQSCKSAS
jgi:hypothetical protein